MNRQIKFRGKRVDTGEFVYGDVAHTEVGVLIGAGFEVEPKSVKQLVGYDADGREVYEGDIFVVPCGTEIAARLFNNITPNAKLKKATT